MQAFSQQLKLRVRRTLTQMVTLSAAFFFVGTPLMVLLFEVYEVGPGGHWLVEGLGLRAFLAPGKE